MAVVASVTALGGDWPMWGSRTERNAVADARNIPHQFNLETRENIRWIAPLGSQTYGGPVVAAGRVLVGTNNGGRFRPHTTGDAGCVLCFDAADGRLLWQATHAKLASGPANDWPEQGVASSPCIAGDRVFYVSNRCELVCLDLAGFADGENDGPVTDERYSERQDADVVWVLDMMKELGVWPHNLAASSPLVADGRVFVCTGNGVDDEHEKPPRPAAPSFLAVDARTGKVVWQRSDPGERILHGQWSSPALGRIGGADQVVFAGGDGWCYAFAPPTGEPLWTFDLNPPGAVWEPDGSGTKTSIVATPVIAHDRVYLAVGDDPESMKGPGHLYAIDATQRGEITTRGRVWHFGDKDFGRTLSSVVVGDGLVYAADLAGYLYCLDAERGTRLWRYDMKAAVWGSPCLADGQVILGNVDGELVFVAAGRELRELARLELGSGIYSSAAVAGDTLFVATQKRLVAIAADAPHSRPAP